MNRISKPTYPFRRRWNLYHLAVTQNGLVSNIQQSVGAHASPNDVDLDCLGFLLLWNVLPKDFVTAILQSIHRRVCVVEFSAQDRGAFLYGQCQRKCTIVSTFSPLLLAIQSYQMEVWWLRHLRIYPPLNQLDHCKDPQFGCQAGGYQYPLCPSVSRLLCCQYLFFSV